MVPVDHVLIDAPALRGALNGPTPPTLLDVRWKLGDAHGFAQYREAHIPGAVYVALDTELAGPAAPLEGRHPLPSLADLQDHARAWGVREGQAIVVYDDNGGMAAARAWWLLRWAGVADVRILDGALAAWVAAGFPTEAGSRAPARGDATLVDGALPTLTADEAASVARTGVLLDARAAERYRGDVEPIDPRAGHIPGALSSPTSEVLEADGRFRSASELRERFGALGVTEDVEVGVYCGSGVTAAHLAAALAIAGFDAALFPGSWSAWSSDPNRPVATGGAP